MYSLLRPLLFSMDAERAHDLTLGAAGWVARSPWRTRAAEVIYGASPPSRLATRVFGVDFASPIGLAAGLDKNGIAIDFWAALGFGFVEVGTVTPGEGQPGNDQPRLERIVEDRAIVNRMGFNNLGARQLAERLAKRRTTIPVGANIGKAKVTPLAQAADDYEETLTDVFAGADYVVVNVSSPNTPGLRDLQAVSSLSALLERVLTTNQRLAGSLSLPPRPILLKIAPDLADDDVDEVASLAVDLALDGIIATNTTLRHDLLSRPPSIQGGMSGRPLGARAEQLVRRIKRRAGAMPIVGVGGISSPDDAYRRIRAGASLVQVYTGFVYEGPGLPTTMAQGLSRCLEADQFRSVEDAVGVDA